MSRETEFELGEGIVLIALVLILGKEIKNLISGLASGLKSGLDQVPDVFGATEGTLEGPAKFVGGGAPLTAQQALSISRVLGQELNYTLSPDHFQIWFFNGAFYDNRDGLVRDAEGKIAGPAFESDGTVNPDAVDALVSATN